LKMWSKFFFSKICFSFSFTVCAGNPDAKRLYDDLLSNYNKLVRPVVNVTDALTVRIKLKLSQLIDVVS
jgi:nicotinic acetylcholine receptor, invertebrate